MRNWTIYFLTLSLILVLAACGSSDATVDESADSHDEDITLPALAAIDLDGQKLNVVATTNIIGDVVSQIGGDTIELTTLLGPNEDPHSYEATPGDLIALEEADIIFVNGWDLEERLAEQIEENFDAKAVVISAEIEPREFADKHDEDKAHDDHDDHDAEEAHDDDDHDAKEAHDDHDEHAHGSSDPHVWFDIENVVQWAMTTETVLSQLDPANATEYEANLVTYSAELEALADEIDTMLAALPADTRKLVTNHDAFGYFADAYDFEVVGTVIPGTSTSAEPSAQEIATLVEAMTEADICTVFTETTTSQALAETVAAELDHCETIQVLPLLTGSLGSGDTATYIGMYRNNVDTIVQGLNSEG